MPKFSSTLFFRLCLSLSILFCLLIASDAQTPDWQWRDLTPTSGIAPEARNNGAAIYDPVGKRFIIVAGSGNSGFLNDTWAFTIATRTWTKLTTTGATPSPRRGFDAVYDPVGKQMLIYAGQGSGFFSDTWSLNLSTLEWRDVSPAVASRPKARYGHAAVFDPVTRSLVQFAGFTEESRRFQDTQSFSVANNSWQDWTPSGIKPEVRCLLTGAFDHTRRKMVIYGGQRSGFLDDLWAFDLASRTWEDFTVSARPIGRLFASSFVDNAGQFIVFGGSSSQGNLNELQSFNFQSKQWTRLNPANPPSKRNGALTAYIEGENKFIVFGGLGDNGYLNDVWELSNPSSVVTTVSAASYANTSLGQEAIVSGFGLKLAASTVAAQSLPLPTQLGGTSISIRDNAGVERLAPLFYVSATQVNYLLPKECAKGNAIITVNNNGVIAATGAVTIADISPGLFSATSDGAGFAAANVVRVKNGIQTEEAIVRWDATISRFVAVPIDVSPAIEDVYLILYGTGWRNNLSRAAVSVRIGATAFPVDYAGAQGAFVGLDQINLLLPKTLAGRGEQDVSVTVDGKISNTVKINLK